MCGVWCLCSDCAPPPRVESGLAGLSLYSSHNHSTHLRLAAEPTESYEFLPGTCRCCPLAHGAGRTAVPANQRADLSRRWGKLAQPRWRLLRGIISLTQPNARNDVRFDLRKHVEQVLGCKHPGERQSTCVFRLVQSFICEYQLKLGYLGYTFHGSSHPNGKGSDSTYGLATLYENTPSMYS